MKPWEYRTRYVLKMAEDETLLGRVVRKPINANPGLKVNWRIGFSCMELFFFLLLTFCVVKSSSKLKDEQNKQKTSLQSYKTQIKVLLFPGLA